MAAVCKLVTVEFEIFGRVQGVFFRRDTKKTANALHLVGWVRNTASGTVLGQVQGPKDNITHMKDWLRNEGSKHSRIDKAEFRNERTIEQVTFKGFNVRH